MQFTVFTPTFNRAKTLPRVYESLVKQTFRDFEWLIVDDGSTDETASLVDALSKTAEFPIRYFYQENSHKKVAHNRAVREAHGELFVILDSDDACVPQALERFMYHWRGIPEQERKNFVGVCGLCMSEDGTIVGDPFPGGLHIDSDSLEIRYRYRVRGEKWSAQRTDVLREFPFREDIPGLVPESTVWSEIAVHYKTRFFNEALRIYYQDQKGLVPRKSEIVDMRKNALGAVFARRSNLNRVKKWFLLSPLSFSKDAIQIVRFYAHCDFKQRSIMEFWPFDWVGKALIMTLFPLGFAMWLYDRIRWSLVCLSLKKN